jgi:DNA-binding transcriptional LysR family regulator
VFRTFTYAAVMIQGVSLERLESFLNVADSGGFAAAAPGNPVRQSQLNRQVRELEEAFGGGRLVERRGRGIVLTAAGERLAAVIREMRAGFEDVARGEEDAPLRFTFGAGDSVLQWWVVPRIADLGRLAKRALPRLITLSSPDVVRQLEDGRLDFGLVRASEVPPGLASRSLGEIHYALYVPRRLMPKPAPDDVGVLLASLPLALQHSEPELNDRLRALASRRGALEAALDCETFPQACRAVRSGRYAAVLPTIVDVELPHREIEEVKHPQLSRFSMRLHLAWHPRTTRRSDRHAALATALETLLDLRDE